MHRVVGADPSQDNKLMLCEQVEPSIKSCKSGSLKGKNVTIKFRKRGITAN